MDSASVPARLGAVSASDSRELDRVCEEAAAALVRDGVEPPFDVRSADFATDPYLICADRYWRLRFLALPGIGTAADCAAWLGTHVAAAHRTEVREKWSLGYAFITKDTVESPRELAEAAERIVGRDSSSGDIAYFATLYHAGKLRSNFAAEELHQFLDASLLALAAGQHRQDPLFTALRAFAAFAHGAFTTEHATGLLDEAWNSPRRTRHVVDICLNGLQMAAPFDGQGELLRSRAEEAVRAFPGDHMFHFRLACGEHETGHHDAALTRVDQALRLLPAIGTRGSHELLQGQYLRKRDGILAAGARARLDAEHARRLAEREAEHQRRWERLEADLRDREERQSRSHQALQESARANAVRAVELVAVFTAAIAFAVGSLQITLNGALSLHDRLWLIAELCAGLTVFALLVIGGTWLITRPRT
ncbi:hypothetical protein I5Q34_13765 [Streptomyces sp. AV19]|uniref:hypothetical protein n=1 Tax=Streptomyces sp. AV19 TaxID=2793068 RepID=UPI0018FEB4BD|nr:hypothetical protein [Streptomyces sp. AV19]MBH1935326.1 hypothetical protein [Streptomyces sp. AV19]MDG4531212.1 hypothetical protein [Streptomyces sp. AV19]